jgi:hypothetical protein
MEANSYRALIDAKEQTIEDDRRGSIEIQYSVELELTSNNVMACRHAKTFLGRSGHFTFCLPCASCRASLL